MSFLTATFLSGFANVLGTGVAPEPPETQKKVWTVKAAVSKRATVVRERERAVPSRLQDVDIREFKGRCYPRLLPSTPPFSKLHPLFKAAAAATCRLLCKFLLFLENLHFIKVKYLNVLVGLVFFQSMIALQVSTFYRKFALHQSQIPTCSSWSCLLSINGHDHGLILFPSPTKNGKNPVSFLILGNYICSILQVEPNISMTRASNCELGYPENISC
ncbi:hypothetical protein QQP08_008597 [Theobroma cacao]|nr:hypothetical protein QQP08_008597 [Theobroma cacao]